VESGSALLPLLAQGGRQYQQDFPAPFGPALANDDAGFNGFAQPHFVGQDDALGKRRAQRKQGGIDLVRVQVNPRGGDRAGQAFQ